MKPSTSLDIYIASSARNFHAVAILRDAFLNRGHRVLDWTRFAPPLPEHLTLDERKRALDSDERGEIYAFCAESCATADVVIYYGPAGQDAACEIGMACACGAYTLGLASPAEKPGLILSRAVDKWCADHLELLHAVDEYAEGLVALNIKMPFISGGTNP